MDTYQVSVSVTTGISIISFLFGALAGHRFALWRDRRNEFNKIIIPLREALFNQLPKPRPTSAFNLSLAQIDSVTNALPWRKRKGFRAAYETYENVREKALVKNVGFSLCYEDPTEIIEHIDILLKYLKRK
jgi:hypothetical protein